MKTKTKMLISYIISMCMWACIVALSKNINTLLIMLASLIMTMSLISYTKFYNKREEELK